MVKVNLTMEDGTYLKEVILCKSKTLGDSAIRTKAGIEVFLNSSYTQTLWYSGKYSQGHLIPSQISRYEVIEDDEKVKKELDKFIKAHSGIWDLTDASEFIMYHREELLRILD